MAEDPWGIVVGHERLWSGPNPNREESLEEKLKKEKLSRAVDSGGKAVGPWDLDNDEIVFPKNYLVDDVSVNEKNSEFIKLQNDLRETCNMFIQTALAKKAQDRSKVLSMHKKNFNNLRAKVPGIIEAIAELNGIAVPYPKHLKNLPDYSTLRIANKPT